MTSKRKPPAYCSWTIGCYGLVVGQVLDTVRHEWVPVCADHYDAAVDNDWTAQPGLAEPDDEG